VGKRAYKYRIYPDSEQEVLFTKTFGCVRFVWNQMVETFLSYNKETNPKPVYQSTTEMRLGHEFLKEVSAAALQQKERDFQEFKKQFFNKKRKVKIKKCKFKKDKYGHQSYRLPNQKFELDTTTNKIKLEKIGLVHIVVDRMPQPDCRYLSVTISRDCSGYYFASVLVEEKVEKSLPKTGKSVGIDLGLIHLLVLSTGELFENPRWFRESQAELRSLQKHLARKKKGSSRYIKCKIRIAKLHAKIARQRKWIHHNIALALIRAFDFIALEDLNIAGMKKNSCLAKSISDAGWAQLVRFIMYKANWYGKIVQKVDRFYASSKTCTCGFKNTELKLHQREWVCPVCGAKHDRDILAANNILKEAQRIFAETAQGVNCA